MSRYLGPNDRDDSDDSETERQDSDSSDEGGLWDDRQEDLDAGGGYTGDDDDE